MFPNCRSIGHLNTGNSDGDQHWGRRQLSFAETFCRHCSGVWCSYVLPDRLCHFRFVDFDFILNYHFNSADYDDS